MTRPPSKPRRRRLLASALVGASLLATAACGEDQEPPPAPDAAKSTYVAIGDSYTAVAGDGPFSDSTCLRTDDNYPSLLAEKLGITAFTDASCGGADSEDLENTQYLQGSGSNPPQLESVSKATTLVTVGIGLNDNDLGTVLTLTCFMLKDKVSDSCTSYLAQPDSAVTELVTKMGKQVAANLKAIRAAAPQARIVLVGYPRVLPEEGSCDSQLPLPGKAAARARAGAIEVNDELKRVATKADADFVDMYAASEGHDVCSKDPWINGQRTVVGEALPFHPFESYHVAVADKLASLLDTK